MPVTIWDYEHAFSGQVARESGKGWTKQAVFEGIPTADVDSLVPAEYSFFPGASGNQGEVLVQSLVVPNRRRPGYAVVTLNYRTLMCDEWLESHPNHGVLLGNVATEGERVRLARSTTDAWGLVSVVEGPGIDGKSWKVVAGTNLITHHEYIAEIYAVITAAGMATYYEPYASMTGFYNNTALDFMPKIGIKGSGQSAGTTFTSTLDKFSQSMEGEQIKIEGVLYRIVDYLSPTQVTLDIDPEAGPDTPFEVQGREDISGTATSSLSNGDVLLTSTTESFYPPMVGSRVRIGGLDYVIVKYVSSTVVHLNADPNATAASFTVAGSMIGKWRLVGLNRTPRVAKTELYTCRYQLQLNRRGWNQPTISEAFTVNPYQMQVTDFVTGNPIPDKYVTVERPIRMNATKEFMFFEGGDLSGLGTLLTDSWAA